MVKIDDLNIWKLKDYCRWYRIDKKIIFFFKKIRWAHQRAKYGYCDRDVWNLDYSLGNYIAATTAHLAETTHGYPHGLTSKEWEDTLTFISNSFYFGVHEEMWNNPYEEEVLKIPLFFYCSNYTPEQEALRNKWLQKEMSNKKAMETRTKEGLNELSKWFFHLWD